MFTNIQTFKPPTATRCKSNSEAEPRNGTKTKQTKVSHKNNKAMNLTDYRKKRIFKEVAATQDGKLKKVTNADPINQIIINAFKLPDDTEDIMRDLEYAIHELKKALDVVKEYDQ